MCTRNKTNREELRTSHTAGKQSFAQVRENKRKEHPDGVPPTRLQLYKVTHTRKDGSPINDIVEQNMEKMDAELEKKSAEEQMDNDVHEDIFTKVMGPAGHGWVHLMGRGVSPKDWRHLSQDIAEIRRENVELRSEVKYLREHNTKHEELISTMQSQLNMLMQIVIGKQQDGAQNIE
ncbi:uncharacterized protein LOC122066737, partial [Macadamia integrifolia]|uniref:uncharacterized protein LOC122066737 n=1 Tax=Macadamia integrifolia TaxID=60698 RepID=UPI001C4F09D2